MRARFEDRCFTLRGQVAKDILRDAFEPENAPRRRIGAHVTGKELVGAARRHPDAWAKLVAHAKRRAAVLRKEEDNSGWEADPFKWEVEGRLSDAPVTFEWKWKDEEEGDWQSELVDLQAYHLVHHERTVALPSGLRLAAARPEILRAKLEAAAAHHRLCEYLGEHQGDSSFEPDPRKWITSGVRAVVWFEWKFVTRNGKPHRVSMRVDNIFASSDRENASKISGNPLSKSAASVTFSLEYLQRFAESCCPGAIYEGFSYDQEVPNVEQGLPKGGANIQDLPLIWSLPPDGRALHASLMCMNEIEEFEAPEKGSDEVRPQSSAMLYLSRLVPVILGVRYSL